MDIENESINSKLDSANIADVEEANYVVIDEIRETDIKRNYFDRNYEKIKWSFGIYHIVFGVWAVILFLNIFLSNIFSIFFLIPLIIYIVCSILGGYRLIKDDKRSINLLLVAQLPQILMLQLNGFYYSLIAGQWFTLTILKNETINFGFNLGVLSSTYNFIIKSELAENGIGINFVPIIAILIILKIEEIDFEKPL